MDNATFDKALTESITEARESAGISLNALSGLTGIPYATLHRKVQSRPGTLLAKDINAIAQALNVPASSLWPEVNA